MSKRQNRGGFTIIEVVLVLAIAGLIFLMVFIALPALQRGQRNTQRKNDLSRFVTAISSYQSNNNGKLPWDDSGSIASDDIYKNSDFVKRYILAGGDASQFQDPDGEDYWIATASAASDCTTGCTKNARGTTDADLSELKFSPSNLNGAGGHRIVAIHNAKCSTTEGTYDRSSGKRDFALFMALEGDSIACSDNQ